MVSVWLWAPRRLLRSTARALAGGLGGRLGIAKAARHDLASERRVAFRFGVVTRTAGYSIVTVRGQKPRDCGRGGV